MRFVLVHGGLHGAWCWEKLIPELRAMGHGAVAIDMPGHGQRVGEKATLDSYRRTIVEVIEEGDVLVGHSMGGYLITMGADAVPDKVAHLVYLAAGVPVEGRSMLESTPLQDIGMDPFIDFVETPANARCFSIRDIGASNAFFYHDCSVEDQRWAFERLTPQPLEPPTSAIRVPNFWRSNVPRSYILCTDDRALPQAIANEQMRRLGLSTCIGINASHSPFLSQPGETARIIGLCAVGAV